jgi:hypothetical protein
MVRYAQIYQDAAKAIADMGVGIEIPHVIMAKLVDTGYSTGAYGSRVAEVKEVLRRDYHLFLKCIPKKGYATVHHDLAIGECENQFYQGYRSMIKGVVYAQYIDVDAIKSAEAKARTIEKAQKMAALTGLVRAGLTKSEIEKVEPKTLKDIAKSIGPVKEKALTNGAGIGEAMKICQKNSLASTSRN